MSQFTAPTVTAGMTVDELADIVAKLIKQIDWLVNGNIDSGNTREIGGWIVGSDSLTSKTGDVGLSSKVTAGDDVRYWSGGVNPTTAATRIYESGKISTNNIDITGGSISWSGVGSDPKIAAAQTAADDAQTNATAANKLLEDIANDNKLTSVEKQDTKKEWDIIVSEKTYIDSQANTYGISAEKTAYGNAYTALNAYITPLLANLTTTNDIAGSTFRTTFKNYYDARTVLLKRVAELAKSLADTAQSTATAALTSPKLDNLNSIGEYIGAMSLGQVSGLSTRLTNITSTGLYTGTVGTDKLVAGSALIGSALIGSIDANKINVGELNGMTLNGVTVNSGTINVGNNISVGNGITLGGNSSTRFIVSGGRGDIQFPSNGNMEINAAQSLAVSASYFYWRKGIIYETVATQEWVSANSVAKFG